MRQYGWRRSVLSVLIVLVVGCAQSEPNSVEPAPAPERSTGEPAISEPAPSPPAGSEPADTTPPMLSTDSASEATGQASKERANDEEASEPVKRGIFGVLSNALLKGATDASVESEEVAPDVPSQEAPAKDGAKDEQSQRE